jgi:hypothetical protein
MIEPGGSDEILYVSGLTTYHFKSDKIATTIFLESS